MKLKSAILAIIAIVFAWAQLNAQETQSEKAQRAKEKVSKMSAQERNEAFKKIHPRKPAKRSQESMQKLLKNRDIKTNDSKTQKNGSSFRPQKNWPNR